MTIRATVRYNRYNPIERLISELTTAVDAEAGLEEEFALMDIDMTAEVSAADPDIDSVAAALAYAYKAGLKAGHIKGLTLGQHDAADNHFWHDTALSLVDRIRARTQDIVFASAATG